MSSVFISHSSKDKEYYVDLLVRLLEHHHIKYWYDSHNIKPGDSFPESIELGLDKAEFLLVILSRNSIASENVIREMSVFESKSDSPTIIPILIEDIEDGNIPYWIRKFQFIDATKNLCDSFEQLFSRLDRKFLCEEERRLSEDRRAIIERRELEERRTSSISQRMRIGFWRAFSITGIGQFENISEWNVSFRMRLPDILLEETKRFTIKSSQGTVIEEQEILELLQKVSYQVHDELSHSANITGRPVQAVYLIEGIAEHFTRNYSVEFSERRDAIRRKNLTDRREKETDPKT